MITTVMPGSKPSHSWTLLSNYTYVLLCLAKDPNVRVRDIAKEIGITERAAMRIISDLENEGFLSHKREGRRNHYTLDLNRPLRHNLGSHCTIGTLLSALLVMSDS